MRDTKYEILEARYKKQEIRLGSLLRSETRSEIRADGLKSLVLA